MAHSSEHLADDPVVVKELLAGKDVLISRLIEEITRLRRWRFGRSAERMDESINPQLPLHNISHPPDFIPDALSAAQPAEQIQPVRAQPDELPTVRTACAAARVTPADRPASARELPVPRVWRPHA